MIVTYFCKACGKAVVSGIGDRFEDCEAEIKAKEPGWESWKGQTCPRCVREKEALAAAFKAGVEATR